jgi:hypothetical protein
MPQEQRLSKKFSHIEIHEDHDIRLDFFFFLRWTGLANVSLVPTDPVHEWLKENKYCKTPISKKKEFVSQNLLQILKLL